MFFSAGAPPPWAFGGLSEVVPQLSDRNSHVGISVPLVLPGAIEIPHPPKQSRGVAMPGCMVDCGGHAEGDCWLGRDTGGCLWLSRIVMIEELTILTNVSRKLTTGP